MSLRECPRARGSPHSAARRRVDTVKKLVRGNATDVGGRGFASRPTLKNRPYVQASESPVKSTASSVGSPGIRSRMRARRVTKRDERASPAAIFRSRRYHIRESLPNMVNRGGPSFSNNRTARRVETPIQLTVALPARLPDPL